MGVASYIALGSNLDNPRQQVARAVRALAQLPESRLVDVSSLYRSAPLGPGGQPDYINAVACIDTSLPPLALLKALQALETRQGRERHEHWGPRTLDLDILLYGDAVLSAPELVIPHPRMKERNFVLLPLAELAPDLQLPGGGTPRDLLANLSPEGIVRLTAGDDLGNLRQRH